MVAAPNSAYSCLMPWAIRATTRAYRLELGKDMGRDPSRDPSKDPSNDLKRFTSEAVTIVDAMANVGCDSAHFLRMFPAAKLIAIEADPKIAAILEANLATIQRKDATPARVVCADSAEFLGLHDGAVIGAVIHADIRADIRADLVYFDPPWCANVADVANVAAAAAATADRPARLPRLCVGSLSLAAAVNATLQRVSPLVVVKLPPEELEQFKADVGASVTAYEINKPSGGPAYVLAFVRNT
jgi:hypothetical protein